MLVVFQADQKIKSQRIYYHVRESLCFFANPRLETCFLRMITGFLTVALNIGDLCPRQFLCLDFIQVPSE